MVFINPALVGDHGSPSSGRARQFIRQARGQVVAGISFLAGD